MATFQTVAYGLQQAARANPAELAPANTASGEIQFASISYIWKGTETAKDSIRICILPAGCIPLPELSSVNSIQGSGNFEGVLAIGTPRAGRCWGFLDASTAKTLPFFSKLTVSSTASHGPEIMRNGGFEAADFWTLGQFTLEAGGPDFVATLALTEVTSLAEVFSLSQSLGDLPTGVYSVSLDASGTITNSGSTLELGVFCNEDRIATAGIANISDQATGDFFHRGGPMTLFLKVAMTREIDSGVSVDIGATIDNVSLRRIYPARSSNSLRHDMDMDAPIVAEIASAASPIVTAGAVTQFNLAYIQAK